MTSASTRHANQRLKAVLKAGKLFEEKYRILRPLGAGSFAVVVHARHEVMERDVALKFLKPKVVANNPEVSERFVKEVQIASRLKHPNVVAIYDFGKTAEGIYYMVQEYIDGVTVDELMPPGEPLARDRALDMMRQTLSCLSEAHSQGIIHRDLKPSNLMSTRDEAGKECVKILDFGVAKLLEKNEDASFGGGPRQSTKFIGTPIYMSPEQILGRSVQPSSDLYSVGLMFYEMLTGQPPIRAEQIAEVVQQHLSEKRFEFSRLMDLDPLFQGAILRATERHPDRRFQSAEDFLRALSQTAPEVNPPVKEQPSAPIPSSLEPSGVHQADEVPSLTPRARATLQGLGPDSEPDDFFLGRNYLSPDVPGEDVAEENVVEEHEPVEFEPIAPSRARQPTPAPAKRPAPAPAVAPTRAGVTPQTGLSRSKAGELELDMDAVRSVHKQRRVAAQRQAARVRQRHDLSAIERRWPVEHAARAAPRRGTSQGWRRPMRMWSWSRPC